METSPKHHPHQHQLNSPSSTSTLVPSPNSHSTTSSTNSNAVIQQQHYINQQQPQTPKPPITTATATTTTRSEPANPYPTTFVQADTSSFKQVVQMLTGSSETAKQASSPSPKPGNSLSDPNPSPRTHIPPVKPKAGFKLYERRNSLKNLKINPLIPVFASASSSASGFSPRKPEILSPSILDFPALVLSPVTPLIPDPFDRSVGTGSCANLDRDAEERAIKEKGFYLHPSPATTPREADPPRLLPLFPTNSPRVSSGSSSLSS